MIWIIYIGISLVGVSTLGSLYTVEGIIVLCHFRKKDLLCTKHYFSLFTEIVNILNN